MFDIMIVDDDEILLYGLEKTIDWAAMDCRIVTKCTDADEAIEKFKRIRPRIIITDICMPGDNGFSLIESVQKIDSDVQFIILSGYPNFDFAQSAIEKNVGSFLLKPTDTNDVIEAVEKAKEKLNRQKSVNTLLRNEALINVLEGDSNINDFLKAVSSSSVGIKDNYTVAVLAIDNYNGISDKKKVSASLAEITERSVSMSRSYILQCKVEKSKIFLLIFLKEIHSNISFFDLLKNIQLLFLQTTEQTLTIGVSGIYKNLNMLHRAWEAAEKAVGQRALLGNGRIIDYTRLDNTGMGQPQFTVEEMHEVILSIKKMDKKAALEIVDDYFRKVNCAKYLEAEDVRNNIEELAILIIHNCVKNQAEMEKLFGRIVKPVVEIENIELVSEIQKWITEIISTIIDEPQTMITGINKPLVQNTVLYIMKHYEEQLTIENVAESMFVSVRHLSRQFKLETGKTFVEYLTDYRMQIAMELLKNSAQKVYEISQEVGYKSLKYFCKIFKERTGLTPLEYRNSVDIQ